MEIVKNSIKEQVYMMIKNKILNQELCLGEQLNPKKIAKENGISMMPVRDALLKLTASGLVVNKPRVGFFVREFTVNEIEDIMEVRKMYELFCIREHFDAIDRKKLKKISDQVNNSMKEINIDDFNQLDQEFHDLIIAASDNIYLRANYNRIRDLSNLLLHLNQRLQGAYEEHKEMVKCIIEGDAKSAEKLLHQHLVNVTASIIHDLKKIKKENIKQ